MRKPLLLLPILLAGCATSPPPAPPAPPVHDGGTCNADGLETYVGQPATPDLGAKMLKQSGASVFRWLPHGAIVTMEFSPGRLNVLLDTSNRVESARCG